MSEANIKCYMGSEEKEITLETLQADMATYLQIDNLSFLVGAGCSSNIVAEKETGIPLMKGLYDSFFEGNPDFEVAGVKFNGKYDHNLEKMLETMGAVAVANQVKEIEPDIDAKIKSVRDFIRDKIKSGLDSQEVKEIYKSFYAKITQRSRKNPISIFTTNYDLFNEIALDELGFPYNNGFSGSFRRKFNPVSYNYMYVENMNLTRDVWERVSSFFNLVKLHGSISWLCKDNEIWERHYSDIRDNETVMIYPTPMKDRSTLMEPYSDLFRTMENRIVQKNSVLVVIGYSFGDDHINRIILNGLAVPSFRLVVFGSGKNITQLTKLGDSRITVYNSDDMIHYFNNFVEKALPPIHPDVNEELKLKPASASITEFERMKLNE